MGTEAGTGAGVGAEAGTGAGAGTEAGAGTGGGAPATGAGAGAAQGAAPTGAGAGAGAGTGTDTGQDSGRVTQFDAQYVKDLRDEAAAKRVEAREAAARADQEKARAEAAEETARKIVTERAVETAAKNLKIEEKLANRLLAGEKLEYDDQGAPKDVEAKLKAILDEHPTLAGQGDTTPRNPQRNGTTNNVDADFAATGRTSLRL